MLECSEPGRTVWLSLHENSSRKYPYTWELIEMPGSLVGINTSLPNRLIKTAALEGDIKELKGYSHARSEVKTGSGSRLDLLLTHPYRSSCYVEIKNCTLVQEGVAMFPDSVTKRGQRHLKELARLVGSGNRGVLFMLIQRMDARFFKPADHIDPEYGRLLRSSLKTGVELIVYDTDLDPDQVRLRSPIGIQL